jgi:hypothetical protein
MLRWTREPDADQRIELAITGFKNGLYKSREDAANLMVLIQIHYAGDSTANINLTRLRILTSKGYYLLRNLQLYDSAYTFQMLAFLLEFERSALLQLRFLKNRQKNFLFINHYHR